MESKVLFRLLVGLLITFGGIIFRGNYVDAQGKPPCGESFEYNYCCNDIPSDEPCSDTGCPNGCCGIKLNTNFPIIGNCIETKKGGATDPTNAFPRMIGVLTKIIMSLILVVCFIFVIYAGILWSANKPKESKDILKKVAITILLLGFSGVILRLINPNFFG